MGKTQDQNLDNQPQNHNNNPQFVEEVPSPSPYNYNVQEMSSPSPDYNYNVHSNIDEQINKPSPSPVNQLPPYPQPSQTPPPAYPPPPPVQFPPTAPIGNFPDDNSTPVQFPPTSTKGFFQDNTIPDHGQQYHQFQPQINNNFDGTPPSQFNQPIPQQALVTNGIPVGPTSWTTELFDCIDDPMNTVTTLFFPCVTFGQIAEIIDNGQSSCITSGLIYGVLGTFIGVGMPLVFILSCTYRTKLRNKYGLIESPAPDWITHFLCELCALCQAYRELQNRGLDPSIGWIGNVAKQQQQSIMMSAPTYQSMNGR